MASLEIKYLAEFKDGYYVLYSINDGVEVPYHLTKDMREPFAKMIRSFIDSYEKEILSEKDHIKIQEEKIKKENDEFLKMFQENIKKKEKKKKNLAKAIASGDEKEIFKAL